MNERSIISVRGVSKYFGDVHAVDNVDLEIERGEFFSLLGPSGCGKTTLLRLLAGLETPSDGEIFIDEQPMSAIPAYRRPVNMVFQNYAIFPHLDVRGNVAFGLRKSSLSKTEINAKVEEMLGLIKLPGYAERSATQLSGGERQRIALARALIKAADLVELFPRVGGFAGARLAPDNHNLRIQMAGPQPNGQHWLFIGLHDVTRFGFVIDGITRLHGKPGFRTHSPVAIATDDPVTFLGKMGMRRIIDVARLQAKTRIHFIRC